jgi:rhamnosyltransferase
MLPPRKEVAIGFVVFYPPESFFVRLNLVRSLGHRVYIYDNSPDSGCTFAQCRDSGDTAYATSGQNAGLGVGLATITSAAFNDGIDVLLFLDQDTGISERTLDFIERFWKQSSGAERATYSAIVFDGKSSRSQRAGTVVDVLLAISSGSLFVLGNLAVIGWHNKTYFVDGVDYEFCLRSRKAGFKIGLVRGVADFDHVSEQPDKLYRILGKSLPIRRYSRSRVADSLQAYGRLLVYCARGFDLKAMVHVFRSMAIYVFGQVVARIA